MTFEQRRKQFFISRCVKGPGGGVHSLVRAIRGLPSREDDDPDWTRAKALPYQYVDWEERHVVRVRRGDKFEYEVRGAREDAPTVPAPMVPPSEYGVPGMIAPDIGRKPYVIRKPNSEMAHIQEWTTLETQAFQPFYFDISRMSNHATTDDYRRACFWNAYACHRVAIDWGLLEEQHRLFKEQTQLDNARIGAFEAKIHNEALATSRRKDISLREARRNVLERTGYIPRLASSDARLWDEYTPMDTAKPYPKHRAQQWALTKSERDRSDWSEKRALWHQCMMYWIRKLHSMHRVSESEFYAEAVHSRGWFRQVVDGEWETVWAEGAGNRQWQHSIAYWQARIATFDAVQETDDYQGMIRAIMAMNTNPIGADAVNLEADQLLADFVTAVSNTASVVRRDVAREAHDCVRGNPVLMDDEKEYTRSIDLWERPPPMLMHLPLVMWSAMVCANGDVQGGLGWRVQAGWEPGYKRIRTRWQRMTPNNEGGARDTAWAQWFGINPGPVPPYRYYVNGGGHIPPMYATWVPNGSYVDPADTNPNIQEAWDGEEHLV